MKLTPLQSIHYPTIKFFLDNNRALGKTELLAFAYLMHGLEHPNRRFKPVDFPNNTFHENEFLLRRIVNLASKLNVKITIYRTTLEFMVEHPNPFLSDEIKNKLREMDI